MAPWLRLAGFAVVLAGGAGAARAEPRAAPRPAQILELSYAVDPTPAVEARLLEEVDGLLRRLGAPRAAPTVTCAGAGVTITGVAPQTLARALEGTGLRPQGTSLTLAPQTVRAVEARALDQTVGSIRKRLQALQPRCSPRVLATADGLRVEVPCALSAEELGHLKRQVTTGGRLAFHEVVDGEPLAKLVQGTLPEGLHLSSGSYVSDGKTVLERLPEAATPEALERWIRSLPERALPWDLALVVEAGPDLARAHVVRRRPALTSRSIRKAEVKTDPGAPRPSVLLELDPEGGRLLEQLTTRLIGRKLAIVLDGKLVSAPLVLGKISGGKALITMGGAASAADQLAEAELLVSTISSGALPMRLTLQVERLAAPAMSPQDAWAWVRTERPEEAAHLRPSAAAAQLERLLAWAQPGGTVTVFDRACRPLRLTRNEATLDGDIHVRTRVLGDRKTVHGDSIAFGHGITVTCGYDLDYERTRGGKWRQAGVAATGCDTTIGHQLSEVTATAAWYGGTAVTVQVSCTSRREEAQRCLDGSTRTCAACDRIGLDVQSRESGHGSAGVALRVPASGAPVDCSTPCPPDVRSAKVAAVNVALRGASLERIGLERHPTLFRTRAACEAYREQHEIPPRDLAQW